MSARELGRRCALLGAVLGDLYGVYRSHGAAQTVLFAAVIVWFWGAVRLVGREDAPYEAAV